MGWSVRFTKLDYSSGNLGSLVIFPPAPPWSTQINADDRIHCSGTFFGAIFFWPSDGSWTLDRATFRKQSPLYRSVMQTTMQMTSWPPCPWRPSWPWGSWKLYDEEVGVCTQGSWRLSDLMLPSTCMCKEVGGYLTRCARIAASIALNDESWVTQSVSQSVTDQCRYRAAGATKNTYLTSITDPGVDYFNQ